MKKDEQKAPKRHFVLTEVEKLEGSITGVLSATYGWFAQGRSVNDLPGALERLFGVSITPDQAAHFHKTRWVPHTELVVLKLATTRAAIEAFGGDAGLDAVLLAKLWELMDQMTIPQLLSARGLFLKVRAQNLKEQEFLFKTGQLKPGQGEDQEADPQTQQRNVLRRIKEIFGLANDEPAEPPAAKAAAGGDQPVNA